LCFGFFYTPVVFLRGVLVAENLPRAHVRRLWFEYLLCVGFWALLLITVHLAGWRRPFLIGYLIPAFLAGNLQSLRKFTEHMGLLGSTILTTTRSVVDRSVVGRVLSESMMHIDYHGAHHQYAKIPHHRLPEAMGYVYGQGEEEVPVFPTYASAMWDMFKTLCNPRVGKQWVDYERSASGG
jgi:hypothetical protein